MDYYPEYTMKSYKSIRKKQTTQQESEHMIGTKTFQKRKPKGPPQKTVAKIETDS